MKAQLDMVDYRFIEVSDILSDFVVEAEFSTEIPPSLVQKALREVCDAVAFGASLPIFFEGLSAISIGGKNIRIAFRFLNDPTMLANLTGGSRDELPRLRTHFAMHVFAKLDNVHEIGAIPFPPRFRIFLNFPNSQG